MPWRRKRQPSPVFLLGKSHGQRSLAGYSLWGLKELDMTKHAPLPYFSLSLTHTHKQTHTHLFQRSLELTTDELFEDFEG